jgi:hypothetical protein
VKDRIVDGETDGDILMVGGATAKGRSPVAKIAFQHYVTKLGGRSSDL